MNYLDAGLIGILFGATNSFFYWLGYRKAYLKCFDSQMLAIKHQTTAIARQVQYEALIAVKKRAE